LHSFGLHCSSSSSSSSSVVVWLSWCRVWCWKLYYLVGMLAFSASTAEGRHWQQSDNHAVCVVRTCKDAYVMGARCRHVFNAAV
jgi:hypothetical protein